MIFSNGLDEKVRNGTKTNTRRLKKSGDYAIVDPLTNEIIAVYDRFKRLKWKVGRDYAIQSGRGKKGDGRFRIPKIRGESLQDISEEDARAEGVNKLMTNDPDWWNNEATLSFKRLWNSIHKKSGTRWIDNPEVWVLEIEYVGSL